MTQEELKTRIAKKEADIIKIEKRIQKWTIGMNEEAKKIVEAANILYTDSKIKEVNNNYRVYKEAHVNDTTVFNKEWNRGPQLGEAYSAYRDLAEANETLRKYKVQLDALNNFDNMEKIEVIWNFLQNWKEKAHKFFIENANKLSELKKNYVEAKDNYFFKYFKENSLPKNYKWSERYYLEREFDKKYYKDIHSFTFDIYKWYYKYDEEKLNKFLDKEVKAKYESLVRRITEKAGEIKDATGLYISKAGEINGYVQGNKNRVRVETITAGGYNIQCLHYRTLVNILKKL